MGNGTDLIIRLLVEDESLDKVERSKAKFDAWGDVLEEANKGATVALAGLGGAAIAAGFAYSNIEQANANLAAQLGLTEPQAAAAGEAAAAAYGNGFGSSLEDVYTTTSSIVSSIAGMRDASSDEIQAVVEKVSTISTSFQIEADRISQVAGQMVSTGLVGSASEGLDLLTVALQRVPAAVREDVIDAVDEYAPFFQAVGLQGGAAMDALVRASEKGMYGIDKTGDAVKEFSIRATDMSTTSKAAFDELGLDQQEFANKLLAGGDTASQAFGQIVAGLQEIDDPATRANASIALFGTPLEDLGVNEIPQFLSGLQDLGGGLGDTAGAAEDMASTMTDTLAGGWGSVQRELEGVVIELGESLAPAISDVIDGLSDFAEWASENTETVKGLAIGAGILAGGIVLLNGAFKTMMMVQAISSALGLFKVAQTGAATATGAQTAAQWANNAAWLASPVTWIIIAIIAAIALLVAAGIWLVQNWDGVVAWLGALWEGFAGWMQGIGDGIASWWNGLWSGIGQWVSDVWNGIVGAVQTYFDNLFRGAQIVGTAVSDWWNGLWSGVGQWVSDVWNGIVGAVQWYFDSLFQVAQLTGQAVSNWWNGLWSGIGQWVSDVWNGIVGAVQWYFDSMFQVAQIVGAAVSGWWNGLWSGISRWVSDVWNGIVGAVRWYFDSMFSVARGIGQGVADWWGGLWSGIGRFFSDVWNGFGGIVRGAWNGILGWIEGGVNGSIDLINGMIKGVNAVGGAVGIELGVIPKVRLPHLATGGVTSGPMVAVIGDNPGGQEMVQPLSMYQASLERTAAAAARGSGGDVQVHVVNKTGVALGDLIDVHIEKAGRKRRVALETGTRKG